MKTISTTVSTLTGGNVVSPSHPAGALAAIAALNSMAASVNPSAMMATVPSPSHLMTSPASAVGQLSVAEQNALLKAASITAASKSFSGGGKNRLASSVTGESNTSSSVNSEGGGDAVIKDFVAKQLAAVAHTAAADSSPLSHNGNVTGGNSNATTGVVAAVSNGTSSSGALDLTPRTGSLAETAKQFQAQAAAAAVARGQLFPPLFAGLPFPTGKSSTTCQICLKTFACNSALEIHYRSHTKERPFKCEVCDRGFSTKGNMKQHMLTHKIRDLPPNLYTTTTTSTSSNSTNNGTNRSPRAPPSTTDSNSNTSIDTALGSREGAGGANTTSSTGDSPSGSNSGRRTSSVSKHVCSVCKKPFSSHSALQIHMRTHTGDKPFQCSICNRAFTTKGNLKVHMGKEDILC